MADWKRIILGGKAVKDCCGAAGNDLWGHSWKCPVVYPKMNRELQFLEWLERGG